MKKILKSLLAAILSFVMVIGVVACGNSGGNSGNGGSTSASDKPSDSTGGGTSGSTEPDGPVTITVYTAVNAIEQSALTAVANAYMDLKYDEGKDVTVIINNRTDPEAYMQAVRNMAGGNVTNPTIVQTSIIPEYYGSNKIVDLTPYLEESNPYISGNTAWKDALEADAYRTKVSGSSETIPGVSYSSNYLSVFYNKKAVLDVLGQSDVVSADGTIDNSKITWTWLMNALKTAKSSGKNFNNPLGLSRSEQSCGEGSFNMLSHLVNMYLDQYFRDFIEKVHSTSGDYSYLSIDEDWTYDQADQSVDSVDKYSFNLNKVVDYYFNQTGYNPTSERYTEVMQNLYDLMTYSDKDASYNDVFSRFNETTLTYSYNRSGYSDLKLFYVEALDYVRTYRDAFKTEVQGKPTVFPSGAQISSELGWFLMPAMESELEGVADNVRSFGGPQESMGILNTGNTKTNEYAVDFLMYLLSPQGQQGIYATYKKENDAPVTLVQLVKSTNIPASINYAYVKATGDCSTSPYIIFGKCSGMTDATVSGSSEYVYDGVAKILSSYFRSSTRAWDGTKLFDKIKSGFASYATKKNFIYNDPAQVSAKTNGLKNSPFNTAA